VGLAIALFSKKVYESGRLNKALKEGESFGTKGRQYNNIWDIPEVGKAKVP